jgi:hypothetical protein
MSSNANIKWAGVQCIRECRSVAGLQLPAVGAGERQHSPRAGCGSVQGRGVQLLGQVEGGVEAGAGGRDAGGAPSQLAGRHGLRHLHRPNLKFVQRR